MNIPVTVPRIDQGSKNTNISKSVSKLSKTIKIRYAGDHESREFGLVTCWRNGH